VRTYAGSRPLLPGDNANVGHVQRIFDLKYHPDDNSIFISGGWDNALRVILLQVKYSKKYLHIVLTYSVYAIIQQCFKC